MRKYLFRMHNLTILSITFGFIIYLKLQKERFLVTILAEQLV